MRQIYRSYVTPIIDYAASTWYSADRARQTKLLRPLEKVQRLGARCILRVWKNVSLLVLEVEAYLEAIRTRLDIKVTSHVAKIFTLELTHPIRKAIKTRKGQ